MQLGVYSTVSYTANLQSFKHLNCAPFENNMFCQLSNVNIQHSRMHIIFYSIKIHFKCKLLFVQVYALRHGLHNIQRRQQINLLIIYTFYTYAYNSISTIPFDFFCRIGSLLINYSKNYFNKNKTKTVFVVLPMVIPWSHRGA